MKKVSRKPHGAVCNSLGKTVAVSILLVILAFTFAACGSPAANKDQAQTTATATASAVQSSASAAAETTTAGKALTLATTTSVNDSGLLEYLTPEFEKDTGIKLKVIAQGTGQAVKTGENGDADVLFIHDKKSEEKFVSEGNGLKRIELMYNYFVVVGPKNDPAGIKGLAEKNAATALKKVMEKKIPFISRGDDSGTNKKELSLWKEAGVEPKGSWYISAGKGMVAVLSMASEKQAYTLTDKATYLSMKDKLDLDIVLENAKNLKNQYTIIAVNPEKHPNVNKDGAQKFIDWMTSDKALKMIADYGKDKFGQSLFTVDYQK